MIKGGNTLILNTDYTVTYTNNTNVGTATVTITGIGNYSGETSRTFTISYNSFNITLDNDNATTNGTSTLYMRYADGVYLDNTYANKMTTSSNPISTLPQRTGYIFDGYYDGATQMIDATGKITSAFTNIKYSSAKTLNAHWTANTAIITIRKNDENWSNSGMNVALYQNGTEKYAYLNSTQSGSNIIFTGVANGTYNIYASYNSGNTGQTMMRDTGLTVTISNSNDTNTIDYYTITRSKGANTNLTTRYESSSGSVYDLSTAHFLKNMVIYITASPSTGYDLTLSVCGTNRTSPYTLTVTESCAITTTGTAQTYTITFDDNRFRASSSSITSSGLTITYDRSDHTLLINGTQTATVVLQDILHTFVEGDTYISTLTYVSGSISVTDSTSHYLCNDARRSDLTVSYQWCLTPPTTSTPATKSYTITSTIASEAAYIRSMLWVASANKVTYTNYKMKVDFTKVQTAQVTYGSTYSGMLPTPASRDYYTFAGWYTAESGGSQVTSSTTVAAGGDRTFYAHWNDNTSPYTEIVSDTRKKKKKSQTFSFKLSDTGDGLKAGTYSFKYMVYDDYDNPPVCDDMTSTFSITVSQDGLSSASSSNITINSGSSTYIAWCNTSAVQDVYGNTRAAGNIYAHGWYLKVDNTAPTPSFTTTNALKQTSQTATLSCSEVRSGGTTYYWGTSAPTSSSTYNSISGSVTKTISSPGTYYFACKDAVGNTSSNNYYKIYYTYKVYNMLENQTGSTLASLNTDNYTLVGTATTYIALNNTSLHASSIYTKPDYGVYYGISNNGPSTTVATLNSTVATLTANSIYTCWFYRSGVYFRYRVNGGTLAETTTSGSDTYHWSEADNGNIMRGKNSADPSTFQVRYIYGNSTRTVDLADYNGGGTQPSITKTGHTPVSGAEWICESGCRVANKTFSQASFTMTDAFVNTNLCTDAQMKEGNCIVVVKVNWAPNVYTINFRQENATSTAGSSLLGTQTCTYGQACTLKTYATDLSGVFPYSSADHAVNSDHTAWGWAFYGWATSTTSKTRSYTDAYVFSSYTRTSDLNLYALGYKEMSFYGGVAPTASISGFTQTQIWNPYSTAQSQLTSMNVPAAISISGWNFAGYKAGRNTANANYITFTPEQAGTTATPAYSEYSLNRSLYSRTLTVSYNANGGSGTQSATTKTQYYNSGYGSSGANSGETLGSNAITLASSSTFTKTGNSVTKWAEGSASGTQYNLGASYEGIGATVTSTAVSKTMYAIWSANTYYVAYNKNTTETVSNMPSASTSYTYATSGNVALSSATPTRSGYTFLGWSTSSTATSASYSAGGNWARSNVPNSGDTFTLYAVWTPKIYKVTLNNQSATSAGTTQVWYKYNTSTYNGETCYYYTNSSATTCLTDYTITKPEKTGYTFGGYYTGTGGGGTQYVTSAGKFTNQLWKKLPSEVNSSYTDTITLYAKWTGITYTITYRQGNGTSTAGTSSIGTSTCTYGSSCTLTTYANLGATFPYSSADTTNTYNWAFAGWTTSQTGTSIGTLNSVSLTNGATFTYNTAGNTTLYALGKRINRFYCGSDTSSTFTTTTQYWNPYSTSTSYLTSMTVPNPADFASTCAISGWNYYGYKLGSSTASSTVTYETSTFGTSVKPGLDNKGYYRTEYSRTLTVKYNKNASAATGTMSDTTKTQYYNSGYAGNDGAISSNSITLANNGFSYTNYEFTKWAIGSSSGTQVNAGSAYTGIGTSVTDTTITKTMYAKWTARTWTITTETCELVQKKCPKANGVCTCNGTPAPTANWCYYYEYEITTEVTTGNSCTPKTEISTCQANSDVGDQNVSCS